jgi:hypothetical protein
MGTSFRLDRVLKSPNTRNMRIDVIRATMKKVILAVMLEPMYADTELFIGK